VPISSRWGDTGYASTCVSQKKVHADPLRPCDVCSPVLSPSHVRTCALSSAYADKDHKVQARSFRGHNASPCIQPSTNVPGTAGAMRPSNDGVPSSSSGWARMYGTVCNPAGDTFQALFRNAERSRRPLRSACKHLRHNNDNFRRLLVGLSSTRAVHIYEPNRGLLEHQCSKKSSIAKGG